MSTLESLVRHNTEFRIAEAAGVPVYEVANRCMSGDWPSAASHKRARAEANRLKEEGLRPVADQSNG